MPSAITKSWIAVNDFASTVFTPIRNVFNLILRLWPITLLGLGSVILTYFAVDSLFMIFLALNLAMLCLITIAIKASEDNPKHVDGIWVVIGILILILSVTISLLLSPIGIQSSHTNPFSDERIAHTFAQFFSFVWAPIGASIIAGSIVSLRTS